MGRDGAARETSDPAVGYGATIESVLESATTSHSPQGRCTRTASELVSSTLTLA